MHCSPAIYHTSRPDITGTASLQARPIGPGSSILESGGTTSLGKGRTTGGTRWAEPTEGGWLEGKRRHDTALQYPAFRRHLRISSGTAFLVGLALLFTKPAQAQPERTIIPPQLLEWKQEVEDKQETLASLYDYKPAQKTLHAAFHQGGVIWAKRYTSSWGGWIYTDWDVAQRLHNRTHRILKDTINQHISGKLTSTQQLEDLRQTMRDFRAKNVSYSKLFQQRIDYDVKQALELDFKHDHELAKRLAVVVGNKALATFHQTMMDHYAKQAEIWNTHGAKVSKQVRDIGYGKTANAPLATR